MKERPWGGYHVDVTRKVIGAAIEVHRALGPGVLENAYRRCLQHELRLQGVNVAAEVGLDLHYKGLIVPRAYRLDLSVENVVVVEVKACEQITDVHEAQLLTYLRLADKRAGLLLNFHARLLREGITRLVL